MSLLFTTLLGLGFVNSILRPIAASIQVSESIEALERGDLIFVEIGGQRLITSPENAHVWSKALMPAELEEFKEAQKLYALFHTVNPGQAEKLLKVL